MFDYFVLLSRSKLNSAENIISKALTSNEFSFDDFTITVNEEKQGIVN